ncbi:MAG: IS91 family transposase [Calditrichales bacterium]|nr:IS91 family transposase [Calditrichales bacterium]
MKTQAKNSTDNNQEDFQAKPELADILGDYFPGYIKHHKLPIHYYPVINALICCRTSILGGHIDECDACGHIRCSYNSCGNRHCPKCRSLAKERWLLDRKNELLPVTYYHAVFTIPDLLNDLVLENQSILYAILFRAASETILKLCADEKHVGALTGMIAILHTWGQTLINHPHLHCIIPGGGISEDRKRWLCPKKSKKNKKFFIHVNIISDLFKKIFLSYLKKAYKKGELIFEGKISYLIDPSEFNGFISKLYNKKWITYCKRPFGGPKQVLGYLGRYTHRVAISNNRLKRIEKGRVYFDYKDYRDGGKTKEMSLEIYEFIRRFLLHILPYAFPKIRYYGMLCSRKKNQLLEICRKILGLVINSDLAQKVKKTWQELYFEITGKDLALCPGCGKGRMINIKTIPRIFPWGLSAP